MVDAAPIRLEFRLTGPPAADTRAAGGAAADLPGQVPTPATETLFQVLQLGQFHLCLALRGFRMGCEDVQDQRGPVHHFHLDAVFQVPQLCRLQFPIADYGVGAGGSNHIGHFLHLATSDVGGGIRLAPPLHQGLQDLGAGGLGQQFQLGHRVVGVLLRPGGPHGYQHHPFQPQLAVLDFGDVLQFGSHTDDPPERVSLGKFGLIAVVIRLCVKGCAHRRTILAGPGKKISAPVLAARNDHRRSRQPDLVTLEGHDQVSATNAHLDGAVEPAAVTVGGRGGDHPGAAAQGFPAATLIDAHEQLPGHDLVNELNVHPRGEDIGGLPDRGPGKIQLPEHITVREHDGVWIADISRSSRERPSLVGDDDGLLSQTDRTQVRCYQSSPGDPNLFESSPGRDGELPALDQLIVQEITGEQPQTVAAHLGDRSVGVAVVHEPQLRIEFVPGHLTGPYHP